MSISDAEQKILDGIVIASANDPLRPEFPADNPKFPATPTYKIKIDGFSDVWLKDEGFNPTGTHKDRMAWEIVVTYYEFLIAKKRGQVSAPLPSMSIISSGSAAFAVQSQLARYNLPSLKVLVDNNFDHEIENSLIKIGCEIYKTDLSAKALYSKDILALTDNESGLDITSCDAMDPSLRFYDWLSYEIINDSPDFCFIPFGTGTLYENLLNINKREVSEETHDPRFKGDVEKLRHCNFIGATTNDENSKAVKLYSPHLPFVHFDEQWIRLYRQAGYCGQQSNVLLLREKFLDEAIEILTKQGVSCEPSAAAGLAVMLQMKDILPRDKKMLIVSTGKVKYNLV